MANPNRICSIDGCGKNRIGHGFCRAHYKRFKKHGDPLGGGPERKSGVGCNVEGCDGLFYSKGYCRLHYRRWSLNGDPGELGTRNAKAGEPMAYYMDVVLNYEGDECLFWPYGQNGSGYGVLGVNGKSATVHRKVCEDVNGLPPTSRHEAAHSCGKGHEGCCAKSHLSWKTPAENQADRLIHGTDFRGEKCPTSKLKEDQVREIISLKGKETNVSVAKRYGISVGHVSEIQNGKTWSWLHE